MKLDCDPTTVYAALLDNRYRGMIHRSDLENPSPLQYLPAMQGCRLDLLPIPASVQSGLCSSPNRRHSCISSPGRTVGRHNFSDSLARHETAVQAYQRATHR